MVKPIIPLARPENDELEPSKYFNQTCHNTQGGITSRKYMIQTHRFDSGTPEEWIIFIEIVQIAVKEKISLLFHPCTSI